jgi:hypothetical protein
MSEIKTFGDFKDWLLIALLLAVAGYQYNTNQKLWERIASQNIKIEQLEMQNAVANDRVQFVIQHIAWTGGK